MDRQDGKNPFDYETYIKPAASIKTMIELRAFCAEFFEKEIAVNNKATDEVRMTSYLKLITYSPNFFARARAVIPELQTSQEESFHQSNPNVQAAIDATYILRGHSDTKWEFLPEEPAWSKLVKDERERLVKAHERQASNGNFYPSPSEHSNLHSTRFWRLNLRFQASQHQLKPSKQRRKVYLVSAHILSSTTGSS